MASTRFLIITSAFLMLMTTQLSAAIYKWKDEAGQVHYGSMPPQGVPAQKMGVSTSFTPTPSKTDNASGSKKTPAAQSGDAGKAAEKDPYTQQQHDTLCKNARNDMDTLNKSGRLRVKQEDGSSAVMSDADRTKRMKTMQEMISKHCK